MQAVSGFECEAAGGASDREHAAVCSADELEAAGAATGSMEQRSAQAATQPLTEPPLALVEKFLRNMSPPLSQARLALRFSCSAAASCSGRRWQCTTPRPDARRGGHVKQVEAAIAALPSSGLHIAHFLRLESISNVRLRELCMDIATDALRITAPADRLAFYIAVGKLGGGAAAGTS
jgi:hypothetical protein